MSWAKVTSHRTGNASYKVVHNNFLTRITRGARPALACFAGEDGKKRLVTIRNVITAFCNVPGRTVDCTVSTSSSPKSWMLLKLDIFDPEFRAHPVIESWRHRFLSAEKQYLSHRKRFRTIGECWIFRLFGSPAVIFSNNYFLLLLLWLTHTLSDDRDVFGKPAKAGITLVLENFQC